MVPDSLGSSGQSPSGPAPFVAGATVVRILAVIVAAATVTALTRAPGAPPRQARAAQLAITHAGVVDVESGRVRDDQTILVEGNRITAVGDARRVAVPPGATTLDATGRFVIPGLWDMHVHATGPGLDRLFLPLLVANGVTGVRDMFSRLAFYDSVRAQSARGALVAPRIVGSGHILDGFPAIWPGSVAARNPDEGRRAVDSLASGGAAFIKVYSRLDPATFRAIAAQAKVRGIPFAGHVPSLVSVDEAVALGIRSIEHVQGFTSACSRDEERSRADVSAAVASSRGWDSATALIRTTQIQRMLDSFDVSRCRSLARRVAARGAWMVPTIVVLRSTSHLNDTTLLGDPRLAFMPRFLTYTWNPANDFRFRAVTSEGWTARRQVYAEQLKIVRLLHEAGVRFLAGTDLANPFIFPGFSLHDELANLVEAGFTPLEAIQAATLNPARFLGATDSLGSVAVGKVADLAILDRNPIADIGNVRGVHAVVLNGVLIDPARRQRLLRDAEAIAAGRPPGTTP